jgi:hypothetical protein
VGGSDQVEKPTIVHSADLVADEAVESGGERVPVANTWPGDGRSEEQRPAPHDLTPAAPDNPASGLSIQSLASQISAVVAAGPVPLPELAEQLGVSRGLLDQAVAVLEATGRFRVIDGALEMH